MGTTQCRWQRIWEDKFVGKRLILSLLSERHEVFAVCRIKGTHVFTEEKPNLFYIWGDLRNEATFLEAPDDIDAAYYLVHSMSGIAMNLPNAEKEVAQAFIRGITKTRIRQIIYLGGIINDESSLFPHLSSRLLVEKVLSQSGIPTTVLRASLIIGSGSASFEIIRDLCEKLPIMVVPTWVNSPCQPIAIRDVIFYLKNVLLNVNCYNKTFDIGGPEILTFKQLMQNYFEKISNSEIVSTWMDSWETLELNPDIKEFFPIDHEKYFRDERRVSIHASREIVIDRIWKIGGGTGYYAFDWAWRLRGMIDKLSSGIGLNRGRKDAANVHVGDSIDFWRVLEADKKKG